MNAPAGRTGTVRKAGAKSTVSESRLMGNYAPEPVTFVRGEGCRLFDDEGREYLDFLCGIAVTSLGHAHPAIAEAVARQAKTLIHVSNLFRNPHGEELACAIDRLVVSACERAGAPGETGRVFFGNSGAEANECALKLARKHGGPGRHVIVSAEGSFHGRTFGALAATGQPDKQSPFAPLVPGFVTVPLGDAGGLEGAVDPSSLAAIILEPIQGENGVRSVPTGFVMAAREMCDRTGALLILDEIQTGLGRTGRWFAFEHHGVVPDVVTIAKSLGNGIPIGACWARADVATSFAPGDHGSTFGGQPLAASAALATLSVLESEGLVDRAGQLGERLAGELEALPGVAEVRGAGLLVGVVLAHGVDAKQVAREALSRGLVVNALGASVVRLAPPLIISDGELDEGVSLLSESLRAVLGAVAA